MKRIITITIYCLLGLGLILGGIVFALNTQKEMRPERDEVVVGSFPIYGYGPIRIQIAEELIFKLDTGSDVSSITQSDLEILRSMGARISEKNRVVMGRNSTGKFFVEPKRYVIDLPLQFYEALPDSTGKEFKKVHIPEKDNVLVGAEFVVVDDDAISSLGVDILENFALEYLYNAQLIRLHTRRPEGYQDFANFRKSFWPSHTLFPGERYYVDLDVDNVTDSYFIDTGLRRIAIKLPASRAAKSRRRLADDVLVSYRGTFPAKTDNVWVEVGNRAGSQKAYYSDTREEAYSINPFNVFTQDLLIDFPSMSLALRPYVTLPRHHFSSHNADTTSTNSQDAGPSVSDASEPGNPDKTKKN